MTSGDPEPAASARLAALETLLADADAWAETLELLGRQWGDPNGRALAAYAARMRAQIRPLLRETDGVGDSA